MTKRQICLGVGILMAAIVGGQSALWGDHRPSTVEERTILKKDVAGMIAQLDLRSGSGESSGVYAILGCRKNSVQPVVQDSTREDVLLKKQQVNLE